MRRRDKTGGKAAKRQRRQTVRRRNTAKVDRRRKPYAADANEKIALLEHSLNEALELLTAMSEILGVISNSPTDLAPVFNAILANATRLCEGNLAALWRYDGKFLFGAAQYNATTEFVDKYMGTKMEPGRAGPARLAALERRTVHIADITTEPGFSPLVLQYELARSVLAVPLLREKDLIGVIAIWRREVRPFTDKQIELVCNFAAQAVIAIENARLLNELRQRTDELGRSVGELRALGEVSQAVNSTLDLETVLSTIVAKAVQLSNTEAGAIYVFDDPQREFRLRATYGMDQELIEALRQQHFGMDEPNVERAFAEGEPIQVADLLEDAPSPANEIVLRAGYRARLVAPLLRGEDVVGMLVVRRRAPGAFPQNIVDLIKTFAAQSAVAIENARLFQNVKASLEDLRTAQDRLVQTQKLASLGQLTAGI